MNEINCATARELAAELALGILAGPERGDLLAHLEGCAACRAHVGSLSRLVDDLLVGAPTVEPPAGFESAVLDRIAVERSAQPRPVSVVGPERAGPTRAASDRSAPSSGGRVVSLRPRRASRWVAAVAAAVLLVIGGFLDGNRGRGAGRSDVRVAAMVSPSGQRVGRVELGRDPRTVFVAVPGWTSWGAEQASYRLRVTFRDGHTAAMGSFVLNHDTSAWGTSAPFDTAKVAKVAMVDGSGQVYCSATFT
jgi:hypothetical protein